MSDSSPPASDRETEAKAPRRPLAPQKPGGSPAPTSMVTARSHEESSPGTRARAGRHDVVSKLPTGTLSQASLTVHDTLPEAVPISALNLFPVERSRTEADSSRPPSLEEGRDVAVQARLWDRSTLSLVWLPILAIALFHYTSRGDEAWIHPLLARCYYLPILYSGLRFGVAGGFIASGVTAGLHALWLIMAFPAGLRGVGLVDLLFFQVVALLSGFAGRVEGERRQALSRALHHERRTRQQLIRAGRLAALSKVVGAIAQHLQAPVQALRTTASLLSAEAEQPTKAESQAHEVHSKQLKRLESILERFLAFGRVPERDAEEVELGVLCSEAVEVLSAAAQRAEVRVDWERPEEEARVLGDRLQLLQVVMALVENAILAAGDGGQQVSIVLRPAPSPDAQHEIQIDNDGRTVEASRLENIFDPFATGGEGQLGLGLSVAVRLADRHGGSVQLVNRGIGVECVLALPGAWEEEDDKSKKS